MKMISDVLLLLSMTNLALLLSIAKKVDKNEKLNNLLYDIRKFNLDKIHEWIKNNFNFVKIFDLDFPAVVYKFKEKLLSISNISFELINKYYSDDSLNKILTLITFREGIYKINDEIFKTYLSLLKIERDYTDKLILRFELLDGLTKLLLNDLFNKRKYFNNIIVPKTSLFSLKYPKPFYINLVVQTLDYNLLIARRINTINYDNSLDLSITFPFEFSNNTKGVKENIENVIESYLNSRVYEIYGLGLSFDLYYFPSVVLTFLVKVDKAFKEIKYKLGKNYRKYDKIRIYKDLEDIEAGSEISNNIVNKLRFLILNFKESLYFDISTSLLLSLINPKYVANSKEI